MKKIFAATSTLTVMFVLLLNSCKKDNDIISPNKAPVANAGSDKVLILPEDSVLLTGVATVDPEGDAMIYQWKKISGPASCDIRSPGLMNTIVASLVQGVYLFELSVSDYSGNMSRDTVLVTVSLTYGTSNGSCVVGFRKQLLSGLTLLGNLSEARCPTVATAGNKIVFAGSTWGVSSAVDIYDVTTQTWTTARLSQGRGSIATVSVGNKIFFAGGMVAGDVVDVAFDNVDIYDVSTNTWSVAHLTVPRGELATAVVGNKIFFAGGTADWWTASDIVDIYDMQSNQWSTARLSQPRMYLGAVTAGDKIYFAGGETAVDNVSTVDIYNNATNSWSTSNLKELTGPVTGVAVDGIIYWAGASGPYNNRTAKVEMWNTNNNTFTSDCLSFSRIFINAIVRNNEIAFFGWEGNMNTGSRFDIYNTQTGEWTVGLMGEDITTPAIINVNNTVYIGGGGSYGSNSNKVFMLSW